MFWENEKNLVLVQGLNSLAVQHLREGIFSPSINVETLEVKLFREWFPRGKPQYQVMYENRKTFETYSNVFLETLKFSSSFSFTFCITLMYKVFWNMFLNNEESDEAKGWIPKDLTLQKSTTAEVFPHVCQTDDYSASCPLLCIKLKSNSSLSIKACHPALEDSSSSAHRNKPSTLTRATYVIPLECITHIFILVLSHLFSLLRISFVLQLTFNTHSKAIPQSHNFYVPLPDSSSPLTSSLF